jgi:histidyl-tRNA synthetase
MNNLGTSSYKGVRDFYPDDMFVQDYIMSVWHNVLQSYGYEHYSASILEPTELYEGKTSDEIVSEQTYSFTDRGGRRVTLRPEMTPTVARMIAQKRRELPFPIRWYSIPNVFRYERPQKGRLREHWQLNVDFFGVSNLNAESEAIQIAYDIMKKFGLTESDFVVKINDRNILNEIIAELDLNEAQTKEFKILLDKKNKMDNFNEKMEQLIGRPFNETIAPNKTITRLTEKLNAVGIKNVVFDPLLIRGFDYYTGVVFEIFDTDPENSRSLFGGGRYDNLLDIFDAERVPAVGFGMGDVTIREALAARNLLPKPFAPAHLSICTVTNSSASLEDISEYANKMAKNLRQSGVDVVVDYSDKKIGDKIKKAAKTGTPFAVCIGDQELEDKTIEVKELESKQTSKMNPDDLASFIKSKVN